MTKLKKRRGVVRRKEFLYTCVCCWVSTNGMWTFSRLSSSTLSKSLMATSESSKPQPAETSEEEALRELCKDKGTLPALAFSVFWPGPTAKVLNSFPVWDPAVSVSLGNGWGGRYWLGWKCGRLLQSGLRVLAIETGCEGGRASYWSG